MEVGFAIRIRFVQDYGFQDPDPYIPKPFYSQQYRTTNYVYCFSIRNSTTNNICCQSFRNSTTNNVCCAGGGTSTTVGQPLSPYFGGEVPLGAPPTSGPTPPPRPSPHHKTSLPTGFYQTYQQQQQAPRWTASRRRWESYTFLEQEIFPLKPGIFPRQTGIFPRRERNFP